MHHAAGKGTISLPIRSLFGEFGEPKEAGMYTEQIAMRTRTKVLLALPFAFTVAILVVLLILLPIPLAGRIPIIGATLLEAAIGVLLVVSLSRVRIVIDDSALTVAFRILIKSRT